MLAWKIAAPPAPHINKTCPPNSAWQSLSCELSSLILSVNGRVPELGCPLVTTTVFPPAAAIRLVRQGRPRPEYQPMSASPIALDQRSNVLLTPSAAALSLLRMGLCGPDGRCGSADVRGEQLGLSRPAPCFAYRAAAHRLLRPSQPIAWSSPTGRSQISQKRKREKEPETAPSKRSPTPITRSPLPSTYLALSESCRLARGSLAGIGVSRAVRTFRSPSGRSRSPRA